MPASPSTDNYYVGKGAVTFKPTGGALHPARLQLDPTLSTHFRSVVAVERALDHTGWRSRGLQRERRL